VTQPINGQAIDLLGITKSWGKTPAVDGIDLAIMAGRFTALLGPSGCGKSTTLRIIAGLEFADRGAVHIGGSDVTHLPPAHRNIAMVFQSYALFPHLSVAENIIFGLKTRGVANAERIRRLQRVAEMLELTPYLDRKPAQLSGGQQQRVALGRAIIAERPVCLMDEPLSNLDARLRHEMRSEIRTLQRKLGFTMVYVTHDQVEAITMADQVALMNQGRLEQAAPPLEIYERPATVFTARFIGTTPMNVFGPAALGESAGRIADEQVLIGVRPEHIRIQPGGPLTARVSGVEYLGAETLIDCTSGGEPLVVKVSGPVEVAPGSEVSLGFAAEDVHLFDKPSGRRRDGDRISVATHLGQHNQEKTG